MVMMDKPKRFLVTLFMVVACWFSGMSAIAYRSFTKAIQRSNLIPRVRSFPDEARILVAQEFLSEKRKSQPTIVIMGDSQPNGLGMDEKTIFSGILNQSHHVINVAFQDSRPKDALILLDEMNAAGIVPECIVYNVNPAHVKVTQDSHLAIEGVDDMGRRNLIVEIFKNPVIWKKGSDKTMRSETPNTNMEHQVPEDYLKIDNPEPYLELLERFIGKARERSPNVIVYMTPHAPIAMENNHLSQTELDRFFQEFVQPLCRRHGVTCLDPAPEFTNADFIDIVHFSARGHRKMADYLEPYLHLE
jgi:hypothetical protein